jgi:hypothetical protein
MFKLICLALALGLTSAEQVGKLAVFPPPHSITGTVGIRAVAVDFAVAVEAPLVRRFALVFSYL